MNNSSDLGLAKFGLGAFISVQAIRQLVQANQGTDSRAGQIASWFAVVLTLIVTTALTTGRLSSTAHIMLMISVVVGLEAMGILLTYDGVNNSKPLEKNRLWFGIAYIIFGVAWFIYSMYPLLS